MRRIVLPDVPAVAERAAELLLRQRLETPERCLGLATGGTMEPVYAALARRVRSLPVAERQRLQRQWRSFNLDEYVGLGADHPGSFATVMRHRLIDPLDLDGEKVQLPDGRAEDPSAEARRYAAALRRAGGIGLQLLGLGRNGHLGFNEPPSAVDAPCRCLSLRTVTREHNAAAFGGRPEAVPPRAITLGMAEILAADRILLVVTGTAKADVLQRAFAEPPTPDLPASWLQRHPAVLLLADAAAVVP